MRIADQIAGGNATFLVSLIPDSILTAPVAISSIRAALRGESRENTGRDFDTKISFSRGRQTL